MTDADRSTHVVVGFNIPASLYLDSTEAGGKVLVKNGVRVDFKHIIMPKGRCGMPIELTGSEIPNDDRGNYSFTSVSCAFPFNQGWPARQYWEESVRIVNDIILAYREVVDRPTVATIGPTDLSQGIFIEGPFPDSPTFVQSSGISGMFVAGNRADGTTMLSSKGFVGGFGPLQPKHGPPIYDAIQAYLDGSKVVSTARRFLQEANRELRHGDAAFAAVLGGSSLEIAVQTLLAKKGWSGGPKGSFAKKFLQDPMIVAGSPTFKTANAAAYLAVERLYKVRNKVAHEGKAYYIDEGSTTAVPVGSPEIKTMLEAAGVCIAWLESHA